MFSLDGKVAIVTGSTRGIGRAVVQAFAEAGARVVVSSRKQEACDAVAAELAAQGHEALAVACHAGRSDELARLVSRTQETFGRLDLLVCNAAVNPVYGPLEELSDEAFDKILQTNVRGAFRLCALACPLIAANGGGAVVLMSSIAGLRASNNIGAYGISKAAMSGLARQLAAEWGPRGIRVNAIAPGLVKTDFARALWEDPERRARAEQRNPLRRLGEAEDIAGVALFLASAAGAYVTGQTIVADGGETIV